MQSTCCSCQGASPGRGSLQTSHSRVALSVNPWLFGVSYRLGGGRAAQPGSAGAGGRLGGSLQRTQNSRARAAQTAESRSSSSRSVSRSSSRSARSRAEPAHLLASNSLHRPFRTLPRAPPLTRPVLARIEQGCCSSCCWLRKCFISFPYGG